MTFKIPLSAQAAANRIHREGVPAQEEHVGEPVTWRGVTAWYLDSEKAALRRLPADELWEIHRLKAELDATVIDA